MPVWGNVLAALTANSPWQLPNDAGSLWKFSLRIHQTGQANPEDVMPDVPLEFVSLCVAQLYPCALDLTTNEHSQFERLE